MVSPAITSRWPPGGQKTSPAEQGKLLDLFAYLRSGRRAPRDAVLSGPRGNGKTTLLRWFCREVEASDEDVDVVWLTPGEIPDLDRLATSVVPPSRFASLRPDTLSLSAGIGRLGWELGGQSQSLTLLLSARCARRPLVLLLDEAHTLESAVGQALLNASQAVSAEAPFLLVMAGTPGLQPHLNTMSATFRSRAEKLGIGRLDAAAAALALVRPLAEEVPAIMFDDGALAHVVEESQRYPYFLQLWGAALWAAARSRTATRIDGSLVADAASEFGRQRTAYYEDRREELERQELLAVAAGMAGAFGGRETLHSSELNAVIAEALPGETSTAEVLGCRDRLAMVGYVWKPPDAEGPSGSRAFRVSWPTSPVTGAEGASVSRAQRTRVAVTHPGICPRAELPGHPSSGAERFLRHPVVLLSIAAGRRCGVPEPTPERAAGRDVVRYPRNHSANANVRTLRATLRAVAGNHASSRPAPSRERADRARIPRRCPSLAFAPMGWQRACVTGAPSGSRGQVSGSPAA